MTELVPAGFVFHQSNLQAFRTCRHSFLLRYVRKLPWPAPLAARTSSFEKDLLAGSTLHSLIHQYFLGINPELLISCAANFPDSRVSVWFNNFLGSQYANLAANHYPEHTLQITLNGNLLLAKFDLISFEEDLIHICDWKTSRVLPKRQFLQDRIQTMVYTLVAARAQSQASRPVVMHYWEASFPDHPIIFEIDEAQLLRYEESLTDLMSNIHSLEIEEFERTSDPKKCTYCEYQSYCARWGTEADEASLYDWFEIGLSELDGKTNNEPGDFPGTPLAYN
ncbi:MAG TPA: PD-(D/E)XK nuclease family protein [Anaerolineaceae bacterium]|nr:PD-(D/E)XK nuclease family protein [Anaerolineaceae bacterium]HQJ32145.1 PD-(D/E)XK nuclease family protein [Anaerolineaceae bacterium]